MTPVVSATTLPAPSVRPEEPRIDVATASDGWAVMQLFGALHDHNASLDPLFCLGPGWRDLLREHLDRVRSDDCGLSLLAWVDREPVGLLLMDGHEDPALFLHRHWAELLALYVAPAARGNALGRRLVEEGLTWARSRGFPRVQLYVTATNTPGRELYRSTGFHLCQEIWRRDLVREDVP